MFDSDRNFKFLGFFIIILDEVNFDFEFLLGCVRKNYVQKLNNNDVLSLTQNKKCTNEQQHKHKKVPITTHNNKVYYIIAPIAPHNSAHRGDTGPETPYCRKKPRGTPPLSPPPTRLTSYPCLPRPLTLTQCSPVVGR